ncbi:MAG: GNAT family N-acetyltransferase [Methylotenera sp.]|nr:GNAT family N-acetyltransferase [Methylotenera sp.]
MPDLIELLSVLFSIEKDFTPDFTKQQKGLALLLQNKASGTIQVARDTSGKVIGMVSAQLVISTSEGATSAWIEDMVVDANYRGQGVGKQLLKHVLAWAKTKGSTRAQLLVDATNVDAIAYYARLNWEFTQLQARRVFL